MEKSESINLRVEPAIKEALVQAATKERRSVSNLVVKILDDWLDDQLGAEFVKLARREHEKALEQN
jgi:uncharacterized protein (DUF1778 family)